MKNLILPILIIFSLTTSAQIPITKNGDQLIFEGIVTADSMTADQIHEAAINWTGTIFNNAKSVITSSTPSKIVGNFILAHNTGVVAVDMDHRLTIDIKPGKARLTITSSDLSRWIVKNNGEWWGMYEKTRIRAEKAFNALFAGFQESILSAKKDDW